MKLNRCSCGGSPRYYQTYKPIEYKPSESVTVRILFGVECCVCGEKSATMSRDFTVNLGNLEDEVKYKDGREWATKLWNEREAKAKTKEVDEG